MYIKVSRTKGYRQTITRDDLPLSYQQVIFTKRLGNKLRTNSWI